MTYWVAAFCLAGALLSLWLVARRDGTRGRRARAGGLQLAIWMTVWALFRPPALLPPPQGATLPSPAGTAVREAITPALSDRELVQLPGLAVRGEGHYRDALVALPPLRLQPEMAGENGWRPHWPRRLTLGDPLAVEIESGADTPEGMPLALVDPFGNRVAEALTGPPGSTVTLDDVPRLAGRWEYQLLAGEGATARSEPVPVVVEAGERPRVLLWLARPGFESAALSRWLRQSGVPARVATRLAPGIQREENLNGLETPPGGPLDSAGEFDLLILDSHLWPQLDQGQRRQLEQTLAQEGSVLWLVGANSPEGFLQYAREQGMSLRTAASAEVAAPPGEDEVPGLGVSGYRPVALRETDALLGAARPAPLYWGRQSAGGALGFVFFHNSYRWVTGGHRDAFARLWQSVLEPQLAHLGRGRAVQVREALPRAGHRVTLCGAGLGQGPAPHLAGPDNSRVGPGASGGNCRAYWPAKPGWYRLEGDDRGARMPLELYVFPAGAWPDWQRALRREQSRQMATARLGPLPSTPDPRRPLPRPWLALLLVGLLAASWWGERKFKR